jgi:HEAT repeat protein
MLSDRLVDVHPDVRRKARISLQQLAPKKNLRPQIIDDGMRVLAAMDWRGQEQAAILLAELKHKPAAALCVKLLTSPRPEVYVTAAWALRRLAVADTLAPVLELVRKDFERLAGGVLPDAEHPPQPVVDHKLSQLNQLLGQQKYAAAVPVLKRFVRKRASPGAEARAAAIWALGVLHEGEADKKLAEDLEQRVADRGIPPEDPRVSHMAAIALGRMKAADALPTLRQFYNGPADSSYVSVACGWAIAEITGKPMPAAPPVRRGLRDWFLLPEKQ